MFKNATLTLSPVVPVRAEFKMLMKFSKYQNFISKILIFWKFKRLLCPPRRNIGTGPDISVKFDELLLMGSMTSAEERKKEFLGIQYYFS